MMSGDLVRCKNWREKDWSDVGIVIEYDSRMKVATILTQKSGELKKFRAEDAQLIKRAPQNTDFLKKVQKNLD